MNFAMGDQKRVDVLGLVSGVIVGDHVHLLPFGLIDDELGQEGHELGRRMSIRCLAKNFASLRIKGCIQRQHPMPVILEAMALGAARR